MNKSRAQTIKERLEIVDAVIRVFDEPSNLLDLAVRSKDRGDLRQRLMADDFSAVQASYLADLRFVTLTQLSQSELKSEFQHLNSELRKLQRDGRDSDA